MLSLGFILSLGARMTALVFVHSPFVGTDAWTRVAEVFALAVVPALRLDAVHASYAGLAQAVVDAVPSMSDAVIVVHSGAGSLAPSIAAALGPRARGVVFVDAVLPHPGRSWLSTVPEDMRTRLLAGVHEGALSRWDQWFPPGVLKAMIPDEAMLAAFVAGLPRVPVAFAEALAPDIALKCPAAYVRLSDAYESEARAAERLNWPVVREPLHHLALLTDPARVAASLRTVLPHMGVVA